MDAIVSLSNLSKHYLPKSKIIKAKSNDNYISKDTIIAVDNVSLDIQEGEIFGIIGNNGAGKTTIIKMLCGLVFPTQGSLKVCGHDVVGSPEKALSNIGAVVEEPTLYGDMTAVENLKYFGMLQGGIDQQRIDDILELVGLDQRKHTKFSTYSLGMKQRLGIAQAIMHNPKVLILDEPINGLDPHAIIQIRDLLRKLCKEHKTTIIISSHILSEMQELCDRVAIISKGKIVALNTVEELAKTEESIISISCDDIIKAEEIIKNNYECQTKIVDGKLFVKIKIKNVGEINKLLVNNDIMVDAINIKKRSLEDVYRELAK